MLHEAPIVLFNNAQRILVREWFELNILVKEHVLGVKGETSGFYVVNGCLAHVD